MLRGEYYGACIIITLARTEEHALITRSFGLIRPTISGGDAAVTKFHKVGLEIGSR